MNTPQNRYELIETLGTGATSRVDKARDTLIGRTVALKTFLQGFGSRDLQQQFIREAQIVGGLSHPNIVALYDVGTNADGAPYLVMEYVEGRTLETVLGSDPLPLARVAVWAGDLATALGQAHRAKIIHGDVKPANILVTPDGQVKLGDFGIAHFATQVSTSGNVMGTPAYLSPEQIRGNLQDSRSDVFSLGIVLYQLSTGVRPFDGDSVGAVCAQIISSAPPPPSSHNPLLPPAFDRVVMRCLSKNPEERYASAEALAADVYPFARKSHTATARAKVAATQRVKISWWSRPFRSKDLWAVAAGVVLLFGVASVVAARRKHTGPTLTATAATVDPPAVAPSAGASSKPISSSLSDAGSAAIADKAASEAGPFPAKPESVLAVSAIPPSAKTSHSGKVVAPRKQVSNSPTQLVRKESDNQPAAADLTVNAQPSSPKQVASLRVEIVSTIAEERLAVYAGQDVLISTRLDSAHLGEALHFDCPLSPGGHPLRVVLYRADESLHVQKEGFAEITSESSNILSIHVNRRSKLLIRKETALEVVWPGPPPTAAQYTSSVAASPTSPK
jgi:serine/threonine protein kinase